MHNVLFVAIWPLALICPFLSRSRFVAGLIVFVACQTLLWISTMKAMSAPDWNESVGDAFVPLVIALPVPLFVALLVLRGVLQVASWAALKCVRRARMRRWAWAASYRLARMPRSEPFP